MPDSGPPNSKIGPSQGMAGGPPSTKIAGGTAPPGGGHAPISATTGSKGPSTRSAAPMGEEGQSSGEKYAEVSTEDDGRVKVSTDEEED